MPSTFNRRTYRILVNGDPFVVHEPIPTRRAIVTLAGLLPVENYTLRIKLAGEKPQKVGLRTCRSAPPGCGEVQGNAA
jgi:hypothetical protein